MEEVTAFVACDGTYLSTAKKALDYEEDMRLQELDNILIEIMVIMNITRCDYTTKLLPFIEARRHTLIPALSIGEEE